MLAIGGGLVLYTAKVVRFAISQKDNYLSKFFGYNMPKIGGNCSLIDCGLSDISTKKIAELAAIFETITDQQILDKNATEAVNGFSALGQIKSGKEIACVFEFDDKKYPLVAYLDESYFRCRQDSFVGQAYLLCKIVRKVPKGQSIKLDEIFDGVKKLPLNRAQRRNMPKNMDNPAELRDVIKGPAFVVLPIAVYQ